MKKLLLVSAIASISSAMAAAPTLAIKGVYEGGKAYIIPYFTKDDAIPVTSVDYGFTIADSTSVTYGDVVDGTALIATAMASCSATGNNVRLLYLDSKNTPLESVDPICKIEVTQIDGKAVLPDASFKLKQMDEFELSNRGEIVTNSGVGPSESETFYFLRDGTRYKPVIDDNITGGEVVCGQRFTSIGALAGDEVSCYSSNNFGYDLPKPAVTKSSDSSAIACKTGGGDDTCTFDMPAENVNVTATFAPKQAYSAEVNAQEVEKLANADKNNPLLDGSSIKYVVQPIADMVKGDNVTFKFDVNLAAGKTLEHLKNALKSLTFKFMTDNSIVSKDDTGYVVNNNGKLLTQTVNISALEDADFSNQKARVSVTFNVKNIGNPSLFYVTAVAATPVVSKVYSDVTDGKTVNCTVPDATSGTETSVVFGTTEIAKGTKVTCSATVNAADSETVAFTLTDNQATPAAITGVSCDESASTTDKKVCAFAMPDKDVKLKAAFTTPTAQGKIVVTEKTVNGATKGTHKCTKEGETTALDLAQTLDVGTNVTCTAEPAAGTKDQVAEFVKSDNTAVKSLSLAVVKGDNAVTVRFTKYSVAKTVDLDGAVGKALEDIIDVDTFKSATPVVTGIEDGNVAFTIPVTLEGTNTAQDLKDAVAKLDGALTIQFTNGDSSALLIDDKGNLTGKAPLAAATNGQINGVIGLTKAQSTKVEAVSVPAVGALGLLAMFGSLFAAAASMIRRRKNV